MISHLPIQIFCSGFFVVVGFFWFLIILKNCFLYFTWIQIILIIFIPNYTVFISMSGIF